MHCKLLLVANSIVCYATAGWWDNIVDAFHDRHLNNREDVVAHVSLWTHPLSRNELFNTNCDAQLMVHKGGCAKVPFGGRFERYRITAEWDTAWSSPQYPLRGCTLMLYKSDDCTMPTNYERGGYSTGKLSAVVWGAIWGPWDGKTHHRKCVEIFIPHDQAFQQLPPGVDMHPQSMEVLCPVNQEWNHVGWMSDALINKVRSEPWGPLLGYPPASNSSSQAVQAMQSWGESSKGYKCHDT
ncbi:hypothetical protein K431DRAFT_348983 [Polychaeton citri CBS 116435]|uniref:Uncharacterized protein n=1 Tax=Polychaeton citri CBS 116435 TaxID=1314669 RepID=A0A9P4Q290_9PEZI|nr:hypothetical protein K431DRAFT_348983 [Polychaeton citri CBS 116435]